MEWEKPWKLAENGKSHTGLCEDDLGREKVVKDADALTTEKHIRF
jgi:hypothetical protein